MTARVIGPLCTLSCLPRLGTRLTAEASLGRRTGRLRQVVCTSRVGGWRPVRGLHGHHVGWIYCLVPSLDATAQRGPFFRRRQCQRTALLPGPAPPRSPQRAARFQCGAQPGGKRFRRGALASTVDATSGVARARSAGARGTLGWSAVYPGRAVGAAAYRSPAGGCPAHPAPRRASCPCRARSPPTGRAGGRSLDSRRRDRLCRGACYPRRAGLRRKQAYRRERGNPRAGPHRPRPAGRHAGP
jgi:hypothetical protein